eukprot:451909-Pleurochrysis_carterae.AAC.1
MQPSRSPGTAYSLQISQSTLAITSMREASSSCIIERLSGDAMKRKKEVRASFDMSSLAVSLSDAKAAAPSVVVAPRER